MPERATATKTKTPRKPKTEPDEPVEDDAMPADPAPRRRSPRSRKAASDSLEAPIREALATVGGVWHSIESARDAMREEPDRHVVTCGSVLQHQASPIAKTLNIIAQDDPAVHKWLSAMMTGGGWGAVAFACWPVAQAIVESHVRPSIERRAMRRYAEPAYIASDEEPMYDETTPERDDDGLGFEPDGEPASVVSNGQRVTPESTEPVGDRFYRR